MNDRIGVCGFVRFEVERNGEKFIIYEDNNVATQAGAQEIVKWMTTQTAAEPSHIGIGTDGTIADVTQTALIAELDYATYVVGGGRAAVTKSVESTNFTNDTAVHVATFEFSADAPTIQEAGLFNAATGGTMFARRTLSYTPLAGDKLTITWKIVFTVQ